ncbi:MAG: superoxide dismutase [Candidatus Dojkabacteria bacterium]
MHTLPALPYEFNALEPHIDAKTMEIHHDKHHAKYIENLNAALAGHDDLMAKDITTLLKEIDQVPEDIRQTVINNGGGHFNHSMFWESLTPNSPKEPTGELKEAIDTTFGGFDKFKEVFTDYATKRFGSGWAWLAVDEKGSLVVMSLSNQDTPFMSKMKPLLGLDVWEHAYYLNYQNKRPDYITAWWNIINWDKVNEWYLN